MILISWDCCDYWNSGHYVQIMWHVTCASVQHLARTVMTTFHVPLGSSAIEVPGVRTMYAAQILVTDVYSNVNLNFTFFISAKWWYAAMSSKASNASEARLQKQRLQKQVLQMLPSDRWLYFLSPSSGNPIHSNENCKWNSIWFRPTAVQPGTWRRQWHVVPDPMVLRLIRWFLWHM